MGDVYLFERVWYGFSTSPASLELMQGFNEVPIDDIRDMVLAYLEEAASSSELMKARLELLKVFEQPKGLALLYPPPKLSPLAKEMFEKRSAETPWHTDVARRSSRFAKLVFAAGALIEPFVGEREPRGSAPPLGPTSRIWLGRVPEEHAIEVGQAIIKLDPAEDLPPIVLGQIRAEDLDRPTRFAVEHAIEKLVSAEPSPASNARGRRPMHELVQESLIETAKAVGPAIEFIGRETGSVTSEDRRPKREDPDLDDRHYERELSPTELPEEQEDANASLKRQLRPVSLEEALSWLITKNHLLKVLEVGTRHWLKTFTKSLPEPALRAPHGAGYHHLYRLGELYESCRKASGGAIAELRLTPELLNRLRPPDWEPPWEEKKLAAKAQESP